MARAAGHLLLEVPRDNPADLVPLEVTDVGKKRDLSLRGVPDRIRSRRGVLIVTGTTTSALSKDTGLTSEPDHLRDLLAEGVKSLTQPPLVPMPAAMLETDLVPAQVAGTTVSTSLTTDAGLVISVVSHMPHQVLPLRDIRKVESALLPYRLHLKRSFHATIFKRTYAIVAVLAYTATSYRLLRSQRLQAPFSVSHLPRDLRLQSPRGEGQPLELRRTDPRTALLQVLTMIFDVRGPQQIQFALWWT
jgi:hypothetical protein